MMRNVFNLLLVVLALLVAGAIINVAVAWGFVAWGSQHRATGDPSDVDRDFWMRQPETAQSLRPAIEVILGLDASCVRNLGFEQRVVRAFAADRRCGIAIAIGRRAEVNAGCPMRCLSGQAEIVGDRWTTHDLIASAALGRNSRPTNTNWRGLPLRPIWPGFAINTIFYAAVLWMLFALGGVPGAVRRRVRIKRGQCASCGYSLRESVSEKCPECGQVTKNV